ncbi:MAG: dihydropteroate synthase [Phycisphaerales bacterium]
MTQAAPRVWKLSDRHVWSLDQPRILAILNLTPDSFSDGGELSTIAAVIKRAADCLKQGADGLDIGGESTRPGSSSVEAEEQIRRVVPAIAAVRRELGDGFAVTIDTTRAEVARAALDAGADAINDVSAGVDDPGMFSLAAARRCGLVLMHRLRAPSGDVFSHQYVEPPAYEGGVAAIVADHLDRRARAALESGVDRRAIVLDPGLGFGKTVEQNLELIDQSPSLRALGFPVISGLSRKSFVAKWAGIDPDRPPRERAEATVRLSLVHRAKGADIFRVHDVEAHARALGRG